MRRKSWLAKSLNIPAANSEPRSVRHWQLMRQLERRRVLAADITGVTVSPTPIVEGDTVTVAATATGIGPLEFDWIITRDSTPIADGFTSSINFTAFEEGIYQVDLRVTDQADQISDTLHFEIVVLNGDPQVSVPFNQAQFEGFPVELTGTGQRPFLATFTDSGVGETYMATVDWGDGHTEQATVIQTQGIYAVLGSHIYADNGTYSVKVTVTDSGGGMGMGTFGVTIRNVAPLLDLAEDQSIEEGSLLSLVDMGKIRDPGFDNPIRPGGPSFETFTYTVDWGDGSAFDQGSATIDQPGGNNVPTLASFDGSHIYADNGTYTVTVTVRDDDGGTVTDTFQVTVTNALPSLVLPENQTVAEGLPLSITDLGLITDPGFDNPDRPGGASVETFTYSVNWGDGSAIEQGVATIDQTGAPNLPTLASFDGSHIYADNGTYTVTVTIMDDDGGVASDTFDVVVTNVAPTLTVGGDRTAVEGSPLSIVDIGEISDPGFDNPDRPGGPSVETFTYTINWGDGSAEDEGTATIDQQGGEQVPTLASFDGSHIYADNGTYTVTVTVVDDDGGTAVRTFDVVVSNAPPRLDVVGNQVVDEGSPLNITDLGLILDPGFDNPDRPGGASVETFTYTINWGDGSAAEQGTADIDQQGDVGVETRASFDGSHIYADNGTYTVTVTVVDDDGGTAVATFEVTVSNVAPMPMADDVTVDEGAVFSLADHVIIRDPGFDNPDRPGGPSFETFSYTIDWGDGSATEAGSATIDQIGSRGQDTLASIGASHVYADNGSYLVTVTVMDDDGGTGVETFTVTVLNVAPTLTLVGNQVVDEGSELDLPNLASISDPGFDNPNRPGGPSVETFTYTINWGDGTPEVHSSAAIDVAGSPGIPTQASFNGGHTYADNGDYTITITVVDDDGGTTIGMIQVTVMNVAPEIELTHGVIAPIYEGGTVTIDPVGLFYDPGFNNPLNSMSPGDGRQVAETFTVTMNWNDGTETVLPVAEVMVVDGSPGNPTRGTIPAISHTYADNDADNKYQIVVTVTDDDGGTTSQTIEITVWNVSPNLSPLIATDLGSDGITNLTITFTDPGADDHDLYIDWGDGVFVPMEDEHTGPDPYSKTISHQYNGPPNPDNPAGDITIRVQVRDDDTKVLGVVEDGFSQIREVTIKHPGTNPNPDIITFPVPLELGGMPLPERVDQVPTTPVIATPTLQSQVPDVRSGGGDVAATSDRYFILVVVNPDGTMGDTFKLPDGAMNDLVALFARLHDDHYRIYLVQTENQSYRLVIDVVTRDGRMTAPGDASSGVRDRPPEAVDVAPADGGESPDTQPPPRLAPGELLERIEAPGEPADLEADPTSRQEEHPMLPKVADSESNSTAAVATAALAAAVVAIDPREDWAVRLERAFASADPRRWRRLRRRRPR